MFTVRNVDPRNKTITKFNNNATTLYKQGKIPLSKSGLQVDAVVNLDDLDPIARRVALANPGCFILRKKK